MLNKSTYVVFCVREQAAATIFHTIYKKGFESISKQNIPNIPNIFFV